MEKLSKVEQACMNYIEQVRAEAYQYENSDDHMAFVTYQTYEKTLKHLEEMFVIIQHHQK